MKERKNAWRGAIAFLAFSARMCVDVCMRGSVSNGRK